MVKVAVCGPFFIHSQQLFETTVTHGWMVKLWEWCRVIVLLWLGHFKDHLL